MTDVLESFPGIIRTHEEAANCKFQIPVIPVDLQRGGSVSGGVLLMHEGNLVLGAVQLVCRNPDLVEVALSTLEGPDQRRYRSRVTEIPTTQDMCVRCLFHQARDKGRNGS
jgi:hypothetical protein